MNTTFPSPRANTIQILNTANELAAAGNEVHLVAKKTATHPEEIYQFYGIRKAPALNLHPVAAPRLFDNAKAHESLLLKKTIQLLAYFRNKPKIVFTRDPLFAAVLLGLKKIFRFRLIYEAHTLFSETARETYMPIAWNERKEKRIRTREKRLFEKSDGIVFISSSLRDFVQRFFSVRPPSIVIHDGTVVPPVLPAGTRKKIVCYSGQFYLWKGMKTLLEAFRWVEEAPLYLFGGGYSTVQDDIGEMKKVIAEYGLWEKIRFCGFLPPSQLPPALAECAAGVLPLPRNIIGNHCNSPLKLFDYMANGLAVIASDLLTVREIVENGKSAHLVEPGNPQSLAEGINSVLKDESYRQKLIHHAFEVVRKYSWKERALHLTQFFRDVS